MESIKLISKYLQRAVKNGKDLEAREAIAWASTLAGITISQANTTVVHAMAHPVSGRTNAPHGIVIALLLPVVMQHTWQADINRFANIAEAMGMDLALSPIKKKAEAAVEKIKKLLKDIGLDIGLKDIGVSKDILEQLTEDTMAYMSRPIAQHPKQFGKEDILKMFNESFDEK